MAEGDYRYCIHEVRYVIEVSGVCAQVMFYSQESK